MVKYSISSSPIWLPFRLMTKIPPEYWTLRKGIQRSLGLKRNWSRALFATDSTRSRKSSLTETPSENQFGCHTRAIGEVLSGDRVLLHRMMQHAELVRTSTDDFRNANFGCQLETLLQKMTAFLVMLCAQPSQEEGSREQWLIPVLLGNP